MAATLKKKINIKLTLSVQLPGHLVFEQLYNYGLEKHLLAINKIIYVASHSDTVLERTIHFNHLLTAYFGSAVHSVISSDGYHWNSDSANYNFVCIKYKDEIWSFWLSAGPPAFYTIKDMTPKNKLVVYG